MFFSILGSQNEGVASVSPSLRNELDSNVEAEQLPAVEKKKKRRFFK